MQFGFGNYDGFREIFVREDGKRKNGILLSLFLNKDIRKWAKSNKKLRALLNIKSMGELYTFCDELVMSTSRDNPYIINILDKDYRSNKYETDRNGVCEDGDFTSYRYRNIERESVFKMKIGKLYKHIIECSEFGRLLNEQVVLFMCEEMSRKWKAENSQKYSGFKLHLDDAFDKIYSSRCCKGNFNSCMTDEDREDFYINGVKAKAAYLTNEEGLIVARCIVYTECFDKSGKVWRLAERQYSSGGDEALKMMLVCALIKGGHIDGYKKVGAGCHNCTSFLDINDVPIPDPRFYIECNRDEDDVISYQDSFKYYNMSERRAYNSPFSYGCCYDLSTTDRHLNGCDNYDEYHEEYVEEDLVTVYYHGDEMSCSEGWLDDFRWVDSVCEYHHEDDVFMCDECDEYGLCGYEFHSELTGGDYCCQGCLQEAEKDWKADNWEYSEYDDEYFEDVKTFYRAIENRKEYIEITISEDSLDELISDNDVVERDGEYYEVSDFLEEYLANNNE